MGIDVFVNKYIEAVKKGGHSEDIKAKEVIVAVAEYAKEVMVGERVINYFFADHGWEHSTRLSMYAAFLIGNLKEECLKEFDSTKWNNMLVLLWSAIALHDIGMNDITKEIERAEKEAKEIGEIIIEQTGRNDHVKKSGEWIAKIIECVEKDENERTATKAEKDFLLKWENYWYEEQNIDKVTALRIVKDIVLMHGENENWLKSDKIGALERDIISNDIDDDDREIYKRIIGYNEALLCLSDLLDICPDRMIIFSNDALNSRYYTQMDETKKRKTFEHWASHRITSVSLDDYEKNGYFVLNMHKYAIDSKMYLNNMLENLYPYLGAVEACIKWGNDERLIKLLEEFGYQGIKIHLRRQNISLWGEINKFANDLKLFGDELILKINKPIDGTSNVFVNELVCQWIKKNWIVNESIGFYHEFSSLYDLFQEGASLHLLYDNRSGIDSSKSSVGYYVCPQSGSEIKYDINDMLLMAINAALEISNQRSNIEKFEILSKGSNTYSALYKGEDSNKNKAYIIICRNNYEDDLNKIIKTVGKRKDGSFVIFVLEQYESMNNTNCQRITYQLNKDSFDKIKVVLNEYAESHWKKGSASNEETDQVRVLSESKELGVGKYVNQLKMIYNGIQAIEEKIVSDLRQDQYSGLFIINLFEMISENSNEGKTVKKADLRYFYEAFLSQNQNKTLRMVDFDSATPMLLEELCEENDEEIRLSEKYNGTFNNLIIHSSKEVDVCIKRSLFQMMIFFWLYNYRKVNFKSLCYREYLTYLSPEQLCDYILNPNITIRERINISFETSEIIAEELKLRYSDEVLKKFIEQFLSDLLKDKNSLLDYEDMICFQSVYRIFRGIIEPSMIDRVEYVINILQNVDAYIGYLGFIESVCSANLTENTDFEKSLNKYLGLFLKKIFDAPDENIRYMAYDILYNYENDYKKEYFRDDWDNICAFLHGKTETSRWNDEEETYFQWSKMRETFMYILKETSPAIRKRNMYENKSEKEKEF